MTWTKPARSRHESGDFAEARAMAERAEATQKSLAARTVASNSSDTDECREFLAMLGLCDPPPKSGMRRAHPADMRSTL